MNIIWDTQGSIPKRLGVKFPELIWHFQFLWIEVSGPRNTLLTFEASMN